MDNTDDQSGIEQRLEYLEKAVMERIDLMEARLIAEISEANSADTAKDGHR